MRFFNYLNRVLILVLSGSTSAQAADEALARQLALTSTQVLPNGITLIQRDIPGSDISHLEVNFRYGQADLPENKRSLNGITFDVMSMSTAKYAKEKIFALTEKLSIGMSCSGGIEQSGCQFETLSENFDQALDLLISAITNPSFTHDDISLAKQRRTAHFQQDEQNPEQHTNTLVNTVFYPVGHPYRQLPQDAVTQLVTFTRKDLVDYHKQLQNAQALQIVYVGPKLSTSRQKKIESAFAGWKGRAIKSREVPAPAFDATKDFVFEDRPIPTAYIRAKFNAPGATSPDAAVSRVLFEILGEVLHEEVRTKRSLSYAIGAMTLQLEQGIGILSASTSKPKETIETMAEVLTSIASQKFTPEKLAEYKNVFTTSHFLTLETHDSFAGALSAAHFQFGDPNKLYEFPGRIAAVTPEDVQKLAKSILTKLRVAVIYSKEKFDAGWIVPLKKL